MEKLRGSFRFADGTVMNIFGAPDAAAALILVPSSAAIWSMRPEAASCGLVTKSNAPRARGFQRHGGALLRMRADHDHGHAMLAQ